MNSKILLKIGKKTLTSDHLIIFSILCLSFSISFLVRIVPLNYGWELNEFDPFFNFRATEYLLENGIFDYLKWNDNLSWYPQGRDIAATSQVLLHVIAATSYSIFGNGIDLYDFTIIFPVIIGSLTCFVIFGVTKNIFGVTAGLISAIFFSISIPILLRGTAGWFKSEPLGLFLGLLAMWIFLSSINEKNVKISIIKSIFSGIIIFASLSAWGGNQFFLVLIGLFIMFLPFLNNTTQNYQREQIIKISAFVFSVYLMAIFFERPGNDFLSGGMSGLSIVIPTLLLFFCTIIKSKSSEKTKRRNCIIFVSIILLIPILIFTIGYDGPGPSIRYLNAINPFLTSSDPLVASISEHSTTTINTSFLFHTIFLIFSGLGIWLILSHTSKVLFKNEMLIFTLILGIFGAFIGSSFSRLEVLTSISLIIISSIALTILIKEILSNHSTRKKYHLQKIVFCTGLVILFIIPLTLNNNNIMALSDVPATILSGGTVGKSISNDWIDALLWLKNNTEKDSIIASWWDYGYWIETIAERTTLVDNATLSSIQIKKIAVALMSSPEVGWKILSDMEADYLVLFLSAEKLAITGYDNQNLYLLQGGGDESKKFYFITISEKPVSEFLYNDSMSGNEKFWNETLLGQLIPFSIVAYVNPENSAQFPFYQSGTIGIYEKNIKFNNEEDLFSLVYSSPGFDDPQNGIKKMVLIYKINKTVNIK